MYMDYMKVFPNNEKITENPYMNDTDIHPRYMNGI